MEPWRHILPGVLLPLVLTVVALLTLAEFLWWASLKVLRPGRTHGWRCYLGMWQAHSSCPEHGAFPQEA